MSLRRPFQTSPSTPGSLAFRLATSRSLPTVSPQLSLDSLAGFDTVVGLGFGSSTGCGSGRAAAGSGAGSVISGSLSPGLFSAGGRGVGNTTGSWFVTGLGSSMGAEAGGSGVFVAGGAVRPAWDSGSRKRRESRGLDRLRLGSWERGRRSRWSFGFDRLGFGGRRRCRRPDRFHGLARLDSTGGVTVGGATGFSGSVGIGRGHRALRDLGRGRERVHLGGKLDGGCACTFAFGAAPSGFGLAPPISSAPGRSA